MTLKRFAQKFGLRISHDREGFEVICGRRGQIWVAPDNAVVATWTNATPESLARIEELCGTYFRGWATSGRVRNAWAWGVRPKAYELAIQMVGARRRQTLQDGTPTA